MEKDKEKMLELLSDEALFGLTDAEFAELAELEKDFPEFRDDSFELTAAAIGMVNLDTSEPLPAHLRAKITADAEKYFASRKAETAVSEPSAEKEEFQKTFAFEPKRSVWQWLGWLVAAMACVALAVNIYTTQKQIDDITNTTQKQIDDIKKRLATPKIELTAAQERDLIASSTDAKQAVWSDLDTKNPKNVQGDVVWSNEKQKGFVRFRNLPVNDKTKQTYQVWIFDKNQKDPVSAGTFDVNENGEIVVPIDSSLKIKEPTMVGITAEKPGGVPKSDLKEVMAVAKLAA